MTNKTIFRVSRLLWVLIFAINGIGKPGEVPVRLDLYIAGGAAYPWTYISEIFTASVIIDFDIDKTVSFVNYKVCFSVRQ